MILEVKANELVIKGSDGGPLAVSIETIRKELTHNYCRTCHSLQGSSIKGKTTISDWSLWCGTREWLCTATTRATDFKKICFDDGGSEDITEQLLERYLQQKLCKYRNKIEMVVEPLVKPTMWIASGLGAVLAAVVVNVALS